MKKLTDLDRVELTKLSYEALNVGETVVVAGKKIGQLTRDVYAKDGMQLFFEPDRADGQLLEVSPESAG